MAEADKLLNLTMEQGATFRATISVFQPGTTTPQNLSNCIGRMQVRSKYNLTSTQPVVDLNSANKGVIVNASGTIDLFVSGNATLAIPVKAPIAASNPSTYVPPSQAYYYDLDLTYPSGDVVRVCYGIVTVYATTTVEPLEDDTPALPASNDDDSEEILTTANYSVAAGSAPEAVVASAVGTAQHLFCVTVAYTVGPHDGFTLTDGPGGALLAIVPPNFPGGDVQLSAPRFFGASVYANTDSQTPAFSIGVGP